MLLLCHLHKFQNLIYTFNICSLSLSHLFFFFFNDTATTEIYTLSLHDALPIWLERLAQRHRLGRHHMHQRPGRSEEHTSELQSPCNLVCRLLLEKKKNTQTSNPDN